MKATFCTISTESHLPQVLTLFESIKSFDLNIQLHTLVTDIEKIPSSFKRTDKVLFYRINDLRGFSETDTVVSKYQSRPDSLRWSMKPVFMKYLLEKENEKVVYVDNDIFFFNDYHFLLELLNDSNVLLSPHWRNTDPELDAESFETNFKDGVFNGGLVAANRNGIPALNWWAKCCAYKCEVNFERGLFVDQKYLDLFPVLFDKVHVIKHQGCNVAYWNQVECKRTLKNGAVYINEKWPIIFIHFTSFLIKDIKSGKDALLEAYLRRYEDILKSQMNSSSPFA